MRDNAGSVSQKFLAHVEDKKQFLKSSLASLSRHFVIVINITIVLFNVSKVLNLVPVPGTGTRLRKET